jgi:hypothetical protein
MPITASDPDQSGSDDLTDVLRHVALDKLSVNRPRVANHPDTRAFLEVGLQLLREDFIGYEGGEIDGLVRCRLFESISLKRLIDRSRALDESRDKPLMLTQAKHKDRWAHKNRYTEDLIAYMFRTAPQQAYMQMVNGAVDSLIATESFGQVVRRLAEVELDMVLADPLFGLHAIVEVTLPNHPRVQEFLRAQEEILLPAWAAIYERIADAYGLQLSPRYTWLDVAVLFNSMINAVLASARSSGGKVSELSNGDNVLVGAIFTMLPALFVNHPDDLDNLYAAQGTRGAQ